MKEGISLFEERLQKEGIPLRLQEIFIEYLNTLKDMGDRPVIWEEEISPIKKVTEARSLSSSYWRRGEESKGEVVEIKLNGGLGTSMGMPYPKSLIKVKEGFTFLDITIRQCRFQGIPLCLMNSFYTHEHILSYLKDNYPDYERDIYIFEQHRVPKVMVDGLEPARWEKDPLLEWNPAGHGDIYAALFYSGLMERFLEMGIRYAFVSNIDNLGAIFEPSILGYIKEKEIPFLMEVTRRMPRDRKGGHVASMGNKIILREVAQCPQEELDCFMDIKRHPYFNTNNIWMDLKYLKDYIEKKGLPRLPLIANPKHIDPRDETSPMVFQLETAMGCAISIFEGARIIGVERKRYIPVKNTADLMVVGSDCYVLGEDFVLRLSSPYSLPHVELDDKFYKKIDQFTSRFPQGLPSLKYCSLLRVEGDVLFEGGVRCIGEVEVINTSPQQALISQGRELTGKIILKNGE